MGEGWPLSPLELGFPRQSSAAQPSAQATLRTPWHSADHAETWEAELGA